MFLDACPFIFDQIGYSKGMTCWRLSTGSSYYNNVRPLAYPDADAVLICFDISRPETLDSVLKKVSELRSKATCLCYSSIKYHIKQDSPTGGPNLNSGWWFYLAPQCFRALIFFLSSLLDIKDCKNNRKSAPSDFNFVNLLRQVIVYKC